MRLTFFPLYPQHHLLIYVPLSSVPVIISALDRTYPFPSGNLITVKRWTDPRSPANGAALPPLPSFPPAYVPPPPLAAEFPCSSQREAVLDDDAQLLISDLPSSATEAIVR